MTFISSAAFAGKGFLYQKEEREKMGAKVLHFCDEWHTKIGTHIKNFVNTGV